MALYESELAPSDGLWDLVWTAAAFAEPRLGENGDWIQVTSERARRPDDPPEGQPWDANAGASFVTQRCDTLEDARALAHDLLAPGRHWRAAVVWSVGEAVYVQAQDAESDRVSATWTFPITRRRRRAPTLDREGGPACTEAPPLRAPTWDGTTWTVRAAGRVVAELDVNYTWPPLLHGFLRPCDGFEDVHPILRRFTELVGSYGGRLYWDEGERPMDLQAALAAVRAAVTLHDPDGRRIDEFELHGYGELVFWTWPDAP